MNSSMRGVRLGLGLLAAGTIMSAASGAAAQTASFPAGAVVQPLNGGGDGAELRRHLTELADNPQSLSALIGAGRAAQASGDTQAALAFFSRAEQVAPRDARVKAGMASALVHMEQPRTALAFFAEAVAMGAPEVEIAADRGLAYDMVGDPRRAQQDYALALRRGDNEEVRRRLALSLAISGQRDAALRAIDDQLRRNDRAAWRTRALILAVSGDWPAAVEAAGSTMPGPSAQAMAPFLARLHGLSPAQKAMAVHFGHFPADGQVTASARPVDTSAYPGALALAGGGSQQPGGQAGLRQRNPAPEPVSTAPRRRPGAAPAAERFERVDIGSRAAAPRFERRDAQQRQQQRQQQAQSAPAQHARAGQPETLAQLAQAAPEPQPQPAAVQQQPAPQPAIVQQPAPPPAAEPAVSFAAAAHRPPPPPVAQAREEGPGFEQVAARVAALPTEPQAVPAASRPSPPPPAASPPAASPPAASPQRQAPARAAAPAHPSRHWVQIAGGADRTALPREFARLRGLAPDLLGDKPPHTTPLRYTNRLLVGPFDSESAAQDFVNRLARHEVAAFAWTSPAGQEIERLRTR